jgi:ribosomal protein S27AE
MLDVFVLPATTIRETKPNKFYIDTMETTLDFLPKYCPYCGYSNSRASLQNGSLLYYCSKCGSKFITNYCKNNIWYFEKC